MVTRHLLCILWLGTTGCSLIVAPQVTDESALFRDDFGDSAAQRECGSSACPDVEAGLAICDLETSNSAFTLPFDKDLSLEDDDIHIALRLRLRAAPEASGDVTFLQVFDDAGASRFKAVKAADSSWQLRANLPATEDGPQFPVGPSFPDAVFACVRVVYFQEGGSTMVDMRAPAGSGDVVKILATQIGGIEVGCIANNEATGELSIDEVIVSTEPVDCVASNP